MSKAQYDYGDLEVAPPKKAPTYDYGALEVAAPIGHGASGSWVPDPAPPPPRPQDVKYTEIRKAHPTLTKPLEWIDTAGGEIIDAAKGIAGIPGAIYHASYDPLTDEEKADPSFAGHDSPFERGIKRMVVDPTKRGAAATIDAYHKAQEPGLSYEEQAKRNKDVVHRASSAVPLVGGEADTLIGKARAGHYLAAAARAATDLALPGVIGETTAAVKGKLGAMMTPKTGPPPATRLQDEYLAQAIQKGPPKPGVAPQDTAQELRNPLRTVYQRFGMDPEDIPGTRPIRNEERAPQSDLSGNLRRGGTVEQLAAVNDYMERYAKARGETDFKPYKSVTIAAADHVVDVTHEPIEAAVQAYGKEVVPAAQKGVVDTLNAAADTADKTDAALAAALRNMVKLAEKADTIEKLNNLKIHANKEVSSLFRGLPSAQIAVSATPVYAYQELAQAVRTHMYPELQSRINPGGSNILESGRLESRAIQGRDGIYAGWTNAATANAAASTQGWLQKLGGGHGAVRAAVTPVSYGTSVASRFLKSHLPMAEYNELLKQGIGSTAGHVPTPVDVSGPAPTPSYSFTRVPPKLPQLGSGGPAAQVGRRGAQGALTGPVGLPRAQVTSRTVQTAPPPLSQPQLPAPPAPQRMLGSGVVEMEGAHMAKSAPPEPKPVTSLFQKARDEFNARKAAEAGKEAAAPLLAHADKAPESGPFTLVPKIAGKFTKVGVDRLGHFNFESPVDHTQITGERPEDLHRAMIGESVKYSMREIADYHAEKVDYSREDNRYRDDESNEAEGDRLWKDAQKKFNKVTNAGNNNLPDRYVKYSLKGTPWEGSGIAPSKLAAAARRGKGKLYDQMRDMARAHWEAEAANKQAEELYRKKFGYSREPGDERPRGKMDPFEKGDDRTAEGDVPF